MRIGFGTGAYHLGDSADFSAQRMVNAYVEAAPPGAEVPAYVRQRYGVAGLDTVGNGPLRGGGVVRGVVYVVSGSEAYQVSASGSATLLGSVAPTGTVTVSGDEINVVFRTGISLYQWDGTTFSAIADGDSPKSQWLANLDGYYVGSDEGTGQFKLSANRDPSDWDGLDFASAEKYPDNITTGIVDHGELILFGDTSGEVFYNSGNADFPIEKVPSGHFEIGCICPQGPSKLDNTVFFPGADGIAYRLNGYAPERISTHSIESKIRGRSDLVGRAWTEAGHKFYSLTCPDFTVTYDVATTLWHERESYGETYWAVAFVLECYGRIYVGDSRSNNIGILTPDVVSDFGVYMRSLGTCQTLSADNKRTTHSRLELVFEAGVGNLTETNPQVMLRWSDDRGKTWSNEKWRKLGAQGRYRQRSEWWRLGQSRSRTYEWSVSSAVRRVLIAADVN